jgi:hypothetical protein
MCVLETSRMRRPWPALGRSATGRKKAVACSHVSSDWNQCQAVVNMVVNVGLYWRRYNFWSVKWILASHKGFCSLQFSIGSYWLGFQLAASILFETAFPLRIRDLCSRFHWYVCSRIGNDSSIFPCITFNRWIACSTDFRLVKLFPTFEWSNNGTAKRNIVIEFLNSSKQFRKEQPWCLIFLPFQKGWNVTLRTRYAKL